MRKHCISLYTRCLFKYIVQLLAHQHKGRTFGHVLQAPGANVGARGTEPA